VCLIGSSTHFLSGISYYTYFLARGLAVENDLFVILMRKLIPKRLYPGRERVGRAITGLRVRDVCPTYDGIDWYGIPSVPRAMWSLLRHRPHVIILEWWTASVFPWYLTLILIGKLLGAKTILELHEDVDSGEAHLPLIGKRLLSATRLLARLSDAYVTHSAWDRRRFSESLGIDPEKIAVIRHGPYPLATTPTPGSSGRGQQPEGHTNLLFFGTIRPYKGLENLIEAFDRLPRSQGCEWSLEVVGETWQGWTLPQELMEQSNYRNAITFVNRYVRDEEVPEYFRRADVVVLPYLRSSASGPLHIAMTSGLPVVVTAVGGLLEAVEGYEGATTVAAGDVESLMDGIVSAAKMSGQKYVSAYDWEDVAVRFRGIFEGFENEHVSVGRAD
jgi:glycosyltransferase involved in cell wall biosynthesis